MTKVSKKELRESFEEVSAYRERLTNEFLEVAKKLRMSPEKINSTIQNHSELNNLEKILSNIERQLNEENQ